MIQRRNLIQASALVACLPSLSFSQNNSPDIGSTVPWSQVKLLNDEVLKASQLKGQVLVIYFWASWCPFCAQQTPENVARSPVKVRSQKTFYCSSGHGLRQVRSNGAAWKGTNVCWRCPGLVALDLKVSPITLETSACKSIPIYLKN